MAVLALLGCAALLFTVGGLRLACGATVAIMALNDVATSLCAEFQVRRMQRLLADSACSPSATAAAPIWPQRRVSGAAARPCIHPYKPKPHA